jgi:Na+/serine symporter
MNKVSLSLSLALLFVSFISGRVQKSTYNNQNSSKDILFIEEYQYVVDEYGIIRFMD